MDAVLTALHEGVTVVTANNRLARNLMLAYNRGQRAAGHVAWRTPAVLPWRAWINQLWSSALDSAESGRKLQLLTDHQELVLWRRIISATEDRPLPGAEATLAGLARTAWRSCQDWQISDADLAAATDSADTAAFAAWAAVYRNECTTMGWVDAGMLPALIAAEMQRGTIRCPTHVHLVGFDAWTPQQRQFLSVLGGAGCGVREEAPPRAAGGSRCRVACPDQRQELDYAARWARQRREVDPCATVAVVVPDLAKRVPEVRRAFLDVFAPDWRLAPDEEVAVDFSFGQPLAAVGLIHAALLLSHALSGSLDYREAGMLLRTPYLPAGRAEAGARAKLELECRELPGTRVRIAELAVRAETVAPVLAGCLRSLRSIGEAAPARQSPGGWADTFREALRAAGWPGDRGLGSDEYQAGLAWQAELDGLHSCDRVLGHISLGDALGLLASLAHDHVFQPAGQPEAIQVMGVLEAVGQRFDALWICGLTGEDWPPATRPDPLLPLALQRRLLMPASSPPLVRERAERLLRWLEASASDVVLSWPEFCGEEPLSSSPLIEHVLQYPLSELPLWAFPRREQSLLAARATEPLIDDLPPPVDPATLPLRGGAALLERQARCPARAFLEFRLGAAEMREPVTGLSAALRGSVTHAVLQEFYRRVPDQRQLTALTDGQRARLLQELIDAQLGRSLPLHDPLMRAIAGEEGQRLHALLTQFLNAERKRMPFRVLATEHPLPLESAPPSVRDLGLRLRVDRIDELPDGRLLIVDYKTGRAPPALGDLWGQRPRAPQLPLYAIAGKAEAIAFAQISAGDIRWIGVGQDAWGIDGVITPDSLTKGSCADWEALRASWWTAIDRLARDILTGDFSVDRWDLADAQGQWAMATRVHELPDEGEVTA